MAHTIFVIEDDPTINQVVCEYFKDSGYNVISAEDGKTAVDTINQNSNIHMFILDIMLPGCSGVDLLNMLRADERYKETPVIMLTALADEYTQLSCFDGLADDYVTKPFSPKILVKRAEALLRRINAMNTLLRIGNIEIDVDAYAAFENGKLIDLTLKELELLKALMNNSRRVLSRQQLLNYAWGYDYFGDERIVDVHIKNLRKKFKSDIIATVKGVGYKLEMNTEDS
jgi:DNA-binding response OmpR family regulator